MSHTYKPSKEQCVGVGASTGHWFCDECYGCLFSSCSCYMEHPDMNIAMTVSNLTSTSSVLKIQVGGEHYKKLEAYQPWEVLKAWLTPEELRGYFKGTAIAYLAREGQKGGDQDIEKAIHTLQGLFAVQRKEESK